MPNGGSSLLLLESQVYIHSHKIFRRRSHYKFSVLGDTRQKIDAIYPCSCSGETNCFLPWWAMNLYFIIWAITGIKVLSVLDISPLSCVATDRWLLARNLNIISCVVRWSHLNGNTIETVKKHHFTESSVSTVMDASFYKHDFTKLKLFSLLCWSHYNSSSRHCARFRCFPFCGSIIGCPEPQFGMQRQM